jgi:hypothetical protein
VGLTGWTREVAKPAARSIARSVNGKRNLTSWRRTQGRALVSIRLPPTRRTGRPEAEILSLIGAAFLATTFIDFIRNVGAVIAAGRTGRQSAIDPPTARA